ncbi:alpha/beta hydrolase [Micromonospora sp. NPDC049044]|uniref:PGAP1-like alpha/beta domain-containing protein n=1 Tax=unclassified Micromonospora TaxID=2617518 RepID=UPI0033FB395B
MTEPQLTVTGGAGGIDARYEDLDLLASHSDEVSSFLASVSQECHSALVDPNVLASAVLNPGGVARFEAALLSALDGPNGMTALAAGFGLRAAALRTVVTAYQVTDEAQAQAIESLRWTLGFALSQNLPTVIPLLVGLGVPIAAYELAGGDIDWQRLITDHPGVVDLVVGASPGLITGLGIPTLDVTGAAGMLGAFYPDGSPVVADLGVDIDPRAAKPPEGFADLMRSLDYRNGLSNAEHPDQIDVRTIRHADGSTAYIVDIPGTKAWGMPGEFSPYLNDLGTNIHVMAGDTTTREVAIADALRRAGASPTDPVMLIGHSQGGMVAAQAAHDSANGNFDFNVTHVVTAGSPIGTTDVPANVQVLSLENSHDIVPHLDAADNPDRPNRTNVTFDTQTGSIGNNHGTNTAYVPAAEALDRSNDPSVTTYRDSASAFLGAPGTTVQTNVYELTRVP